MSSILFVAILISLRAHHHGSCGGWWLDGGQHLLYTGMAGDIPVGSHCVYVTFLFFLFCLLSCLNCDIYMCFPAMPLLLFYIYFKYIEYNPILNHLLMAWGLFYSRFYRGVLWIQCSMRSLIFKLFPRSWCLMDNLVRLKSLQLILSFLELLQSTAAPWSCFLLSLRYLMLILFFSLF